MILIKFYLQNMRDLRVDKFYYFNKIFFDKFFNNLNKNFFIFKALNNNKTISSILILFSRKICALYVFL